jgi:hypothetical protein
MSGEVNESPHVRLEDHSPAVRPRVKPPACLRQEVLWESSGSSGPGLPRDLMLSSHRSSVGFGATGRGRTTRAPLRDGSHRAKFRPHWMPPPAGPVDPPMCRRCPRRSGMDRRRSPPGACGARHLTGVSVVDSARLCRSASIHRPPAAVCRRLTVPAGTAPPVDSPRGKSFLVAARTVSEYAVLPVRHLSGRRSGRGIDPSGTRLREPAVPSRVPSGAAEWDSRASGHRPPRWPAPDPANRVLLVSGRNGEGPDGATDVAPRSAVLPPLSPCCHKNHQRGRPSAVALTARSSTEAASHADDGVVRST